MANIDWITVGPMLAKILADLIAAERSRSGLTTQEIFQRAGAKLDENEAKLLEDLARLTGD
jgi:hypothetical protein